MFVGYCSIPIGIDSYMNTFLFIVISLPLITEHDKLLQIIIMNQWKYGINKNKECLQIN